VRKAKGPSPISAKDKHVVILGGGRIYPAADLAVGTGAQPPRAPPVGQLQTGLQNPSLSLSTAIESRFHTGGRLWHGRCCAPGCGQEAIAEGGLALRRYEVAVCSSFSAPLGGRVKRGHMRGHPHRDRRRGAQ